MAHSRLLDEHNKACTAILREQIKKAQLQKEIAHFVEKSNLKVEWSKYKWLTRLDLQGVVDDNNFTHVRILSMLDLVRKIVVQIPSPKSKKSKTSHLSPKSVPIDLANTHSVQKRGRRERGSRHSSCSSSSESSQSSICSSDDCEYRSRRRYRRERRHRYSASSRSDRKRKRHRKHKHRRREIAHSKKHSRKISLVL